MTQNSQVAFWWYFAKWALNRSIFSTSAGGTDPCSSAIRSASAWRFMNLLSRGTWTMGWNWQWVELTVGWVDNGLNDNDCNQVALSGSHPSRFQSSCWGPIPGIWLSTPRKLRRLVAVAPGLVHEIPKDIMYRFYASSYKYKNIPT